MARRAPGYERDGLAVLLLALQRMALTELRLGHADSFLDVGCATGAAARTTSQPHVAIGIDRSPVMIDHACRQARVRSHFVVADAEHLPFPDATFTAALCTSVLHYLDDPTHTLAELARVLHPAGRMAIGDFENPRWPAHRLRSSWIRLTVTRTRRTLTPFGFYVIMLVRPRS